MGSIITLYGNGTGGAQNAVANIQVPKNGVLVGVHIDLESDLDADAEFCVSQVAFRDTFINSNDNGGYIAQVSQRRALTTSGVYHNEVNVYIPTDVPVALMEKIYLNLNATAGVVSTTMVGLHFDFTMVPVNVRRQ